MFVNEFMRSLRLMNLPSPDLLNERIRRIGHVSLFRCSEVIGDDDEEQLRSAISSQSRSGSLVLDFAEVTALDSVWLGALVKAAAHAIATGVRVKLMNLRPSVESFLRQNNLLTAFDICSPSEEIALWCKAVCIPEHSI